MTCQLLHRWLALIAMVHCLNSNLVHVIHLKNNYFQTIAICSCLFVEI